jgi:hypothetical protein
MVVAGALTLAWALIVWQWQDPFTAAYTHWQQHKLAQRLEREVAAFHPARPDRTGLAAERRQIEADARTFRQVATPGQAIGRIVIGRLDLHMVRGDRPLGAPLAEARAARAAGVPPALLCHAPLHRLREARLGRAARRRSLRHRGCPYGPNLTQATVEPAASSPSPRGTCTSASAAAAWTIMCDS